MPPKKVIRALYDYQPQNPNGQELAFHKGDFFHVLSRENDTEWYEACDPRIPAARGLVPVNFFEVIGKQQRLSDNSVASDGTKPEGHDSGFSEKGTSHARSTSTATSSKPGMHGRVGSRAGAGAMVYGIVLYDFKAERPDELQAEAGEAIIVIAQSNPEWFVAKPIGRLGGPGLIPVSFIEIKDMVSGSKVEDPLDAVRRAGVPRVEEWKKMAADYKNSSISLGKLDGTQQSMSSEMGRLSLNNGGSPTVGQGNQNNYVSSRCASLSWLTIKQYPSNFRQSQPQQNMFLAPVSASVPRYCFDNDTYWYIIECQMEDGRHWELSRYYNDFYDFQIKLLEGFPEEAGNRGKARTLPFMPGPVAHVTDAISNGRRQNLDEYIRKILSMAPHISKCSLLRQFFSPRQGDFEIDPNAIGEEYRLSSASQQSLSQTQSNQASRQSLTSPTGGQAYGGMPPPGARPSHQRGQPSMSATGGVPGPNGTAPFLHTQASTLTQTSASSSVNATTGGAMKIKVFFQEDIIAIRVPISISFAALKQKLIDRLRVNEDVVIQYKDEQSNSYIDMENDDHLEVALTRNPKLTLYVAYAADSQ